MSLVRKPKHNLHTKELFDKIRKRLGLTEEEFPNKTIRAYYRYLNEQILEFIMDNPEGLSLTIGNKLNGVLAVSKHMPKEMREDKFEKLESIEENPLIPEFRKAIYRKRYATALNRRVDYNSFKKEELEFHSNSHSFFYSYRFMWFNKRNCKIKKTKAYIFEASNNAKKKLEQRIRKGEDFFELQFNDFYRFRIKPEN